MPKIPQFEQQQLASLAVGTPGAAQADTSRANVFKSIVSAAEGVQSQSAAAIRQQQLVEAQALREKEREAKAAQKELDNALESETLTKYKYGIEKNNDQIRNQVYQDTLENPENALSMFEEQAEAGLNETLDAIADPILRSKVSKVGYDSIRENAGLVVNNARSQRMANVVADTDLMLKEFSVSLGNAQTPDELMMMSDAFIGKYGAQKKAILGEAQFNEKFFEAREAGVLNWLANKIDSENPRAALDAMESGIFDKIVNKSKVKHVFADYRGHARRVEQKLKDQEQLAEKAIKSDFAEEYYDAGGSNAPLSALHELQTKYGDSLPLPEQKKILSSIQKAQDRIKEMGGDKSIVSYVGNIKPRFQRLHAEMESDFKSYFNAGRKEKKEIVRRIDQRFDAYEEMVKDLEAAVQTVKNENARTVLRKELAAARQDQAKMKKIMTKFPETLSEQDAMQAQFMVKMGEPKPYENMPQEARVFSSSYRMYLRDNMSELFTKKKMEEFLKSEKAQQILRDRAKKHAHEQVVNYQKNKQKAIDAEQ